MMFDCDDLMSQELVTFKKTIKDIKEKDMKKFGNWTKIYKALNYDIFEGLEVKNTIKFNEYLFEKGIIFVTFKNFS